MHPGLALFGVGLLVVVGGASVVKSDTGPLHRCPGSPDVCCHFQEQQWTKCTFDPRQSCDIWRTVPGARQFSFHDDGYGQSVNSPHAVTKCSFGAKHDVPEPAIFQSTAQIWTRNGRDARLGFKYLIPAGTDRLTNITVHAVFDTGRLPVLLSTASATSYDAWTYSQFYLRDLGTSYALRFTAYGKCDEVIKLDDIVVDSLVPTSEIGCLRIPTTPSTTAEPTTPVAVPTTTVAPATTRRFIPTNSVYSVLVKLGNFTYTPDKETCDSHGGACDPEVTVRYRWTMKELPLTVIQTFPEQSDVNHVTFDHLPAKVLGGPIRKGARIVVYVDVADIDSNGKDDIGTFEFSYTVPYRATSPKRVTLRDRKRGWFSVMTVEFETVF
ncbi:hypothetical protein BV898_00401 [Hypsibius exemplaris]|uniref:MAM domain-containing protein n=1 Tax=Hypsibius exemplaris TaxID=2072580 RepID=A0A1W0XDE2_HYPEX|nr:hypothetical protein BV898_00401 [Hypsibius exemplaris]